MATTKKDPKKKPAAKAPAKKAPASTLPKARAEGTAPPGAARAFAEDPPRIAAAMNALSVSDVAREVGVDPKKARAALRRAGKGADGKRYATVQRGSDEHAALVLLLGERR